MKYLALILVTIALTACASNSQREDSIGQYCYTDQEITRSNGEEVASETVIKCSDRPKVNHLTRSAGVASECRSFTHTIQISGRNKNVKGFLCKFPDGNWERVNGAFAH